MFNDDLLNDENSLRINPNSVDEIRHALEVLYRDEDLKKALSERIFNSAQDFRIETRCKKIIDFINCRKGQYSR